ncbi:MAG: hypothetical protein U9O87_01975 [Verrucomicrobiota bacterium]|nr:hypothetical protein [Verrucomicrobiota bacterium]
MLKKIMLLSILLFIVGCTSTTRIPETHIINKNLETEKVTGDSKISMTSYKGWANCIEIKNSKVKVILVPAVARVMYFGASDGTNLLWENKRVEGETNTEEEAQKIWSNYGGEKLWISPQALMLEATGRYWPPEYYTDSCPWETVEIAGNTVTISSRYSPNYRLQLTRTFCLKDNTLEITNTIQASENPFDFSLAPWSVLQIIPPKTVVIARSSAKKGQPGGFVTLDGNPSSPDGVDELSFPILEQLKSWKIGAHSHYIRAEYPKYTLIVSAEVAKGRLYHDHDSAIELYVKGKPMDYIELETLGIPTHLSPYQRVSSKVKWTLE